MVDASSPAKAHPQRDRNTEVGRKRVRQGMELPEVRQVRFDGEAAAAAQEVVAKVPGRAACRQEEGRRFIDPDAARRGRAMTSDSRRKEQRSELVQKKRLDTPSSVALVGGGGAACGGRRAAASPALAPRSLRRLRRCAALAMAASCCRASSTSGGADYEYAIAEALMLMHAVEPRACAFPLLELPEELQLLVAGHVVSPRDRAALCVAVPPLGRKAIKEIPTYTGPLMSLGKRVLSGGAVDEAEVRRYVREFAPSEAEHASLALNECAQLNAMAAPSARVRCVVQGSNLEWRLESGALLRCWKPFERTEDFFGNEGNPGMHHYEGAAGAERLVSVAFADGAMRDFRGERGAEVMWQYRSATGYYRNRDIAGWWASGFWHPNLNSATWRVMMATRPCASCTWFGMYGGSTLSSVSCGVCV